MTKKLMVALAFALAMGAAQSAVLLQEDFDDIGALEDAGWVLRNASIPPGVASGWDEGNPEAFPAHQGAANSYIASSFLAAGPGGTLNDQLFTPEFSVEHGAIATFFMRAEEFLNYRDIVTYGYTDGVADPAGFVKQMTVTVPTGTWTRYEVTLAAQGAGATARLGFIHVGPEATSDYVGLDTLRVNSLDEPEEPQPVPEPATLMILGIGMAGLTLARRRR